jgi:hypothetical protein
MNMSAENGQVGLRLDRMLVRDLTLQWEEAVAMVNAVCRQLLTTGASGFPAASQIVLYGDGAVVALASTQQADVTAAAHLLGSLLNEGVPLRLRLLASQAMVEGAYSTLKEFSDALAYFERPDARLLLQGLHERASSVPFPSGAAAAPAVALPPPAAQSTAAARPSKRRGRAAIGAALVAAVLCAAAWLSGARLRGMDPVEHPAAGGETTNAAPTAGSTERPTRASQSVTTVRGVGANQAKPVRTAGPPRTPALEAGYATDLQFQSRDGGMLLPPITPFRAASPELSLARHTSQSPLVDSDTVYSRVDPDVVPPHNVYPKLRPLPPGARNAEHTVVDLLISAEGLVEHVQLRTPPRDVHEFMLLSAAKAWRFDPATVHGRPVRFRHSLAIPSRE